MDKNIFSGKAGDDVFIMLNNVPTKTRIRVIETTQSLENYSVGNEVKEKPVTRVRIGVFADINNAFQPENVGRTKEELIHKIFGEQPSGQNTETKQPTGFTTPKDDQGEEKKK